MGIVGWEQDEQIRQAELDLSIEIWRRALELDAPNRRRREYTRWHIKTFGVDPDGTRRDQRGDTPRTGE